VAKILIIDDDEQVLLTLAEVVKSLGHTTQTAPDGRAGLQYFFADNYDLVLTDLAMPEVNGLQVLKRIKASRPEIGVIVVTGNSTMDLLAAAINEGVDAYVTKPFKISEIDIQLKRILARPRPLPGTVADPPPPTHRKPASKRGVARLAWAFGLLLTGIVIYLVAF
jgi:DNA-binding response OmpR family regulator